MPSRDAASCPKYGGKVCRPEAGALCECYPGKKPSAASTYRLWVSADRQTLVRVWSDGTAEVAHRGPSGIWGPTVKLIEERVS